MPTATKRVAPPRTVGEIQDYARGLHSGYSWAPSEQRYYLDGAPVPRKEVTQIMSDQVQASIKVSEKYNEAYRKGSITLDEWHAGMQQELQDLHLQATAAGRGGLQQMGEEALQRANDRYNFQAKFLSDWRDEIADNPEAMGDARAADYCTAARGSFINEQTEVAKEHGATYIQSFTHSGDSCPDCIDNEAMGVVPIDEMPELMDCQCGSRCLCTRETYVGDPTA